MGNSNNTNDSTLYKERFLRASIADLDPLSARAFNALHKAKLRTVAMIAELTKTELAGYTGIGEVTALEIETLLKSHGVDLAKEEEDEE